MWGWLLHVTGCDNLSGPWYGFWSGFAGDIPLFGAAYLLWRKHNCHAKGCHRIGLHKVEGTPHVTCRKHHPALPNQQLTADQIKEAHDDAAASG